MENEQKRLGWHFTGAVYGCERITDALQYGHSSIVSRVELEKFYDQVAQPVKVLWQVDVKKVLHEFGCICAEEALYVKNMVDSRSERAVLAKRDWVKGKITSEKLAEFAARAWVAATEPGDIGKDLLAGYAAANSAGLAVENVVQAYKETVLAVAWAATTVEWETSWEAADDPAWETARITIVNTLEEKLATAVEVEYQRKSKDKPPKTHSPLVVWFTGFSGAGKTTIATGLEKFLLKEGFKTIILDADCLRVGLNNDLSFTNTDRAENVRRAGEVAKLFFKAGYIVLVACISPYREGRRKVRELFKTKEFVEVFVGTPLEICEHRDPKGLYAKARKGEITEFTGVDLPYEIPEHPELVVHSVAVPMDKIVKEIWEFVDKKGYLHPGD